MQLKWALGVWAIRYPVPLMTVGALLFFGYQTAALAVGAIYVTYLATRLALWPRRYLKRRRLRDNLKNSEKVLKRMLTVYLYCQPPVISPVTLREQLTRAAGEDVPFHGAVFAILDRIIARDQGVFVPLPTQ